MASQKNKNSKIMEFLMYYIFKIYALLFGYFYWLKIKDYGKFTVVYTTDYYDRSLSGYGLKNGKFIYFDLNSEYVIRKNGKIYDVYEIKYLFSKKENELIEIDTGINFPKENIKKELDEVRNGIFYITRKNYSKGYIYLGLNNNDIIKISPINENHVDLDKLIEKKLNEYILKYK